MKITFLGTNGWYDTSTGNTICTFIETNDYYIILDAGHGLYKIDHHIKDPKKPIYLFLSHFHLDHITGLHILNKFKFKQPLTIYGQKGTRKTLNNIIKTPYTIPFSQLHFPVKINEIEEGKHNSPFPLECRYLIHPSPCLGYRFMLENKIITYCTDTGISSNAVKLAKDADLLITECSLKLGEVNANSPHLNPLDAIKIAKKAKSKRLALTHFDASNYLSMKDREKIRDEIGTKFQDLLITQDNMEIDI